MSTSYFVNNWSHSKNKVHKMQVKEPETSYSQHRSSETPLPTGLYQQFGLDSMISGAKQR